MLGKRFKGRSSKTLSTTIITHKAIIELNTTPNLPPDFTLLLLFVHKSCRKWVDRLSTQTALQEGFHNRL